MEPKYDNLKEHVRSAQLEVFEMANRNGGWMDGCQGLLAGWGWVGG